MKPILILPKNTPVALLKEAREAGYFPIPTDDPEKVHLMLPTVTGDDLMMSAMAAIQGSYSSNEKARFTEELWRRIKAKESKSNTAEP